jgi:hypothetical protein
MRDLWQRVSGFSVALAHQVLQQQVQTRKSANSAHREVQPELAWWQVDRLCWLRKVGSRQAIRKGSQVLLKEVFRDKRL